MQSLLNARHTLMYSLLALGLSGCTTIGHPYDAASTAPVSTPAPTPVPTPTPTPTPTPPVTASCNEPWLLLKDATQAADCSVQLTSAATYQQGELVWPDTVPGSDWVLGFTATVSNTTPTPADGFAVVLGDPALGATTQSVGTLGSGLGARGIPGFVFMIDVYRNLGEPAAPYFGITRGELKLWETPFLYTTSNLPQIAKQGAVLSHKYVFTMKQSQLTVTLDGTKLYSGPIAAPQEAYLYITSATGDKYEQVSITNLSLQTGSTATTN